MGKHIFVGAVCSVLVCLLLFGAYWLAKHGSYWLWYEDMVKETVAEMVKPSALK